MIRTVLCLFLFLTMLSCAGTRKADLKAAGDKTATHSGMQKTSEASMNRDCGLGYEHRGEINSVQPLMAQKKFDEAIAVLDKVVEAIESAHVKGKGPYLSFDSRDAFDAYCQKMKIKNAVFMDGSYRNAYYLKAFIANEQGDQKASLALLNKVISISPEDPTALCEMGNNLIALKDMDSALAKYLDAYAMAKEEKRFRTQTGMALRGMGFVYIEMGRLQEAEKAYQDSLLFAPDNPNALHELEFIKSIRSR